MSLLGLIGAMSLAAGSPCPLTISTTQQALKTPAGWIAYQSARQNNLEGVEVFFDDPKTLSALPPENVHRTAKSERYLYRFPSDTKQIWFDCHYTGTAVVLRKRLADTVRRCELTIDRRTNLVGSIVCK